MTQLTIRGFDERLESRLRRVAEQEGLSLNKAALLLMRRGAGLGQVSQGPDLVGDSLDEFIGVWSEDEEKEFLQSIRACDQIDEDLWR